MRRKPRDPRIGIFTRPVITMLLAAGVWSALVNIGLLTWLVRSGRPVEDVQAMTFIALVLIQFFNAYNCRSDRVTIFHRPFANRWLNTAVAWELVLLGLIVYVPFAQGAFGTFSMTAVDWILTGTLALSIVPVIEAVKWLARGGRLGALA
jgi:Ca2+-transporting ATPase